MPTPGNSINESTTGISGFTGTAFIGTAATQYNVLVGGSTSSTLANIAPSSTSGIPLVSSGSSANPSFTTAVVAGGGTGNTSFTAYSVIAAGTTATGAFQNVSGIGSSGQVLTSNGAGNLPTWQAASATGFTSIVTQTFTSSGTYTPTASMKYCIVEVIGGGGAGGSVDGVSAQSAAAAGGGAGGYARKSVSAATIGVSQTVTIGAGGTPGASGNNPGGNGGTTSLGSIVSATGGSGGSGNASSLGSGSVGGLGGAGSSGDVNVNGSPGGAGYSIYFAGTAAMTISGMGGNSYFGGGGLQIATNAGSAYTGHDGVSPGAGGGGAGQLSSLTGGAQGGAGVKGIVVITEFI